MNEHEGVSRAGPLLPLAQPPPPPRRPPRTLWSWDWISGLVPAVIVHLLLAWAVHVFDFVVVPLALQRSTAQGVAYVTVFQVLLILMVWSYWKCTLAQPKPIPRQFDLTDDEFCRMVEGYTPASVAKRTLPVISRARSQKVAVCANCKLIKPDRCHHCSVCRRCVLKMDHHCPWVNNCVGHHNYKFFVLFVLYASLFLATMIGMMAPFVVQWMQGKNDDLNFEIPLCTFVAGVMGLCVLPLACMHCSLLCDNQTTLEQMRQTHRYSRPLLHGWRLPTWYDNVVSVFGPRVLLWPLPVDSCPNDGVHWDVVLETGEHADNRNGIVEVDEPPHEEQQLNNSDGGEVDGADSPTMLTGDATQATLQIPSPSVAISPGSRSLAYEDEPEPTVTTKLLP